MTAAKVKPSNEQFAWANNKGPLIATLFDECAKPPSMHIGLQCSVSWWTPTWRITWTDWKSDILYYVAFGADGGREKRVVDLFSSRQMRRSTDSVSGSASLRFRHTGGTIGYTDLNLIISFLFQVSDQRTLLARIRGHRTLQAYSRRFDNIYTWVSSWRSLLLSSEVNGRL